MNTVPQLILNSLRFGIPALTEAKANVLMESCVWCLNNCNHKNGVNIELVHHGENLYYSICWPEDDVDIDSLKRAYNQDDAVEFGAEAISFLLIRKLTPYTAIKRAVTGEGIDYWLGYDTKSLELFSESDARLEISGILKEKGTNTIKNRINAKMKQTKPTDHTFPVYISIIEFSQPKSEVVVKK